MVPNWWLEWQEWSLTTSQCSGEEQVELYPLFRSTLMACAGTTLPLSFWLYQIPKVHVKLKFTDMFHKIATHTHTVYTVKTLTTGRLNVVHSIAIQLHHFWRLRFLLLVVTHSKCILRHLHQNIVPLLPFFPHCFSNCIKITETHTVPMYILFHTHCNVCIFMQGLRLSQRSCWILKSSGMWCCIADVSKDHTAFIFTVKQSRITKLLITATQSLQPSGTSQTASTFFFFFYVSFKQIILQSHRSPRCQSELHYHISHNLPFLKLNKVGSDIIMLSVSWHFNYWIR